MKELPTVLFRIMDTELNEFWTTSNKKSVWNKSSEAKQAWSRSQSKDDDGVKYVDQSRYKVVKYLSNGWRVGLPDEEDTI